MSKRFCDTEIWQKEWFLNLSAVERQLFLYIKDNCDCAGFFVPNYALLSFVMGQKITKEDFTGDLGDVIRGKIVGRENDEEIIVFETVGVATQDLIAAKAIYDKAVEAGIGTHWN